MAEIRNVQQIAQKWSNNAQQATQSYKDGVQTPRRPWQAATLAAAQSWQAGVTAAAQGGRFARGVQGTTEQTQRDAAMTKGADRYAQGVALAQSKYAARFAPYAQVIQGVQLPPRGPRGAAQNLQRVAAIATALNQRRTSGGGGGNG